MVEILMEQKITMVDWTETEKELRVSPELRQVRLDVIGIDEVGELYQVEMQEKNTYNIPKRSRYYQAQIDVSLLEPGCGDFNKLNDLTKPIRINRFNQLSVIGEHLKFYHGCTL